MSFRRKAKLSTVSNASLAWPKDAKKITEDSHKESCSIKNKILGVLNGSINQQVPDGDIDLTKMPDFMAANELICNVNSIWESIPADVRDKFGHSVETFADFMSRPENYEAIAELGFDNSYLPTPEALKASSEAAPSDSTTSSAPSAESASTPASETQEG